MVTLLYTAILKIQYIFNITLEKLKSVNPVELSFIDYTKFMTIHIIELAVIAGMVVIPFCIIYYILVRINILPPLI